MAVGLQLQRVQSLAQGAAPQSTHYHRDQRHILRQHCDGLGEQAQALRANHQRATGAQIRCVVGFKGFGHLGVGLQKSGMQVVEGRDETAIGQLGFLAGKGRHRLLLERPHRSNVQ